MFRRIRNWWYLRVLGQPVIEAGSVPGSTVTRHPSPLEEGETVYKADPMSMGAQGHAYFQGSLPDMQTEPTMALATNRRVVLIGDAGLVSLSLPCGDITEY